MKKRIPCLFILILFSTTVCNYNVFGQNHQHSSNTELTQLLDSIEVLMEKNHIPGLLVTLVNKDSVIWEGGLGLADIEAAQPVSSHHLFRMGSISKSFAGLSILKLVRDGKIELHDKLADVAPEIEFDNPWEETHPVRIVHLLQHTAGFDDMHFHALYNRGKEELPAEAMVRKHQKSLTSRWPPGSRMAYSNPGFVILGYLIEKLSGKSYHEYVAETVFRPLDMKYSNFLSFQEDGGLYTQGYQHKNGTFNPIPFYPINGSIAGTLNSCAEDMRKLLHFFIHHGKIDSVQLFTPGELTLMETPSSTLAAEGGIKTGYGLANYTSYLNKKITFRGHNGGIDGFSSVYAYNRDAGVGFALSNNANGPTGSIQSLIIGFLTQDLPDPDLPSASFNGEAVSEYEGYYSFSSPRNQIFALFGELFSGISLLVENDTLFLQRGILATPMPLVPVDDLMFRNPKDHMASIILTQDETGEKVFSQSGSYYVKSSFGWLTVKLLILGLSCILTMAAIPFGLVWILLALAGKSGVKSLLPVVPAWVGSTGLLAGIICFFSALSDLPTSGLVSGLTIVIFLGSLLFGAGSLASLVFSFLYFRKTPKSGFGWYILITAIGMTLLTLFLAQGGLIGLQLWAY